MQTELDLTGEQLRDAGADRVTRNTHDEWIADADTVIAALARSGNAFTAEDVRQLAGDPPNHPNAMGARLLAAARHGIIERAGFAKPLRPQAHARVLAVWRGVKL